MPIPEMGFGYSVVFTTPYVIAEEDNRGLTFASEREWLAYFERNLETTGRKDQRSAYEYLLKYGLNRHYWNEYVSESYSNYRSDMVLLVGFPDKAKGEATWALTGIAHRIGREVFAEELRNSPEPEKVTESDVESFVDQVFKYSVEDVEQHFEVFYDTDGSSLSGFAGQDKLMH